MMILALDQSTSATKAILFDQNGSLVKREERRHKQIHPYHAWYEHDPMEILDNTVLLLDRMNDYVDRLGDPIQVISITNQRETVVVWDKDTGQPVYNAIVWQCNRAQDICDSLRESQEKILRHTGLPLSPYFSAAKIRWILDHVPGVKKKAKEGKLLFGTMDSWLLWNLCGVHKTDCSNASRTQLLNIETLQWDEEIFDIFDIPISMAPELSDSDKVFGYTMLGESKVPVAGIISDSSGALFGQHCIHEGTVKVTYGTGSSIMVNTGGLVRSRNGLVSSCGYRYNGTTAYVLEGNLNCIGSAISWLVDNIGIADTPQTCGSIAANTPHREVYFVPALTGLGAPFWCSEVKARFVGMDIQTKAEDLVRAVEESIAYQVESVLASMRADLKGPIQKIKVDGGPTKDEFLMQFQADISRICLQTSRIQELSAWGSACMAGLALGIWTSVEAIEGLQELGKSYEPILNEDEAKVYWNTWNQICRDAIREINEHKIVTQ